MSTIPSRLLRASPALALLLALALAPPAGAHHEPTTVRYVVGTAHDSSLQHDVIRCTHDHAVLPGMESVVVGGACSLAAPAADVVHVKVTQDPGLRMTFKWWGLDDAGKPCGIRGVGFDVEAIERPAGCTHFAVQPYEHGQSGTIAIW